MVHGIRWPSPRIQHCIEVLKPFNCHLAQTKPKADPFSALHVMEVRKERKQPIYSPLFGLAPYFLAWTFVPLYLYLQPVILHHHLIPFVFYVGLINAYSVGQMIIAHLTKNLEFPMYNVLTIPLGLAVLDSLGPMLFLWPSALGDGTYQIAFVFCCLGLGVGVYGSFVVSRISLTAGFGC